MINKIKIDGVVGSWEVQPDEVVAQIERQTGDLEISLNSVGGSVMGGVSIANAIRAYDKGTVTIIVDAVSASIASYFMMFADKVIVHDNTTVMIHNAWLIAMGDFNELRKSADISEGLSSVMAKAYVNKTSKSETDIRDLMDAETYYYGADIVANGFADEVIETQSETTEAEAKALTISSLEACNKAVMKNETVDLEAVAKLIPKKEDEDKIQKEADEKKRLEDLEAKKVLGIQAQQKRKRNFALLKLKRK